MTRNLSLEWLDGAMPSTVAAMDADTLAALVEEVEQAEELLKSRRRVLDAGLAAKYARNPQPGTGWITDGSKAVRVEVPKSVEWDQAKLREAAKTVEGWGEDPTEYLTMKLSVAENAYKAWPTSIRRVFDPARTVKAGKPKISFHAPKSEAA